MKCLIINGNLHFRDIELYCLLIISYFMMTQGMNHRILDILWIDGKSYYFYAWINKYILLQYIWCNLYETVRHIDTKKKYIFFGCHSKTWPMKWKKTLLFLQFGEKKYP